MIRLGGLTFRGLTREDLLSDEGRLKIILPVNAEAIVLAREATQLRDIIDNSCSCLDGQVPYLAARLRYRQERIEKLSGSELIYDFAAFAGDTSKRLFLLGGYPESNAETCRLLSGRYRARIDGFAPPPRPYPFDAGHNSQILDRIAGVRPDILFVGFGLPKQEYWLRDNYPYLDALGVRWAVAAGGTFELASGREARAPRLAQRMCLEGVWRLAHNPRRWRRFIKVLKVFNYLTFEPDLSSR